jgi:hypothetical protein
MTHYVRGAYKAEVIAQGLGTSKAGNPQFWIQAKILESIDDPTLVVEQYDRTIFWSITEGTIEFVCEKLERLGFKGDSFRLLDPNVPNHHSFVGQVVDLFCKLETYDGKEREKWDLSRGVLSGPPNVEPLGDAAARQLDALFGRKLKERTRGAAVKPQGVPAAQTAAANAKKYETEMAATGDEIPF